MYVCVCVSRYPWLRKHILITMIFLMLNLKIFQFHILFLINDMERFTSTTTHNKSENSSNKIMLLSLLILHILYIYYCYFHPCFVLCTRFSLCFVSLWYLSYPFIPGLLCVRVQNHLNFCYVRNFARKSTNFEEKKIRRRTFRSILGLRKGFSYLFSECDIFFNI